MMRRGLALLPTLSRIGAGHPGLNCPPGWTSFWSPLALTCRLPTPRRSPRSPPSRTTTGTSGTRSSLADRHRRRPHRATHRFGRWRTQPLVRKTARHMDQE